MPDDVCPNEFCLLGFFDVDAEGSVLPVVAVLAALVTVDVDASCGPGPYEIAREHRLTTLFFMDFMDCIDHRFLGCLLSLCSSPPLEDVGLKERWWTCCCEPWAWALA